jgi:threonine/homoserine/homoserine lactone efflux protein
MSETLLIKLIIMIPVMLLGLWVFRRAGNQSFTLKWRMRIGGVGLIVLGVLVILSPS